MPVAKPFKRTFRQLFDGTYADSGNGEYTRHPDFASAPEQYVRAYLLLQKDLLELFDYVEPADGNAATYSYRIHELLVRTCVEVEANCKAVLKENGYSKVHDWTMNDYKKLEATHRLSRYQVKAPLWHGNSHTRTPFASWGSGGSLAWYTDYHAVKHNRHEDFAKANFSNLMDAVSGLAVLLAAQFGWDDFGFSARVVVASGPEDGFEDSIGNYFLLKYPTDWPPSARYGFQWQDLRDQADPIQKHNY